MNGEKSFLASLFDYSFSSFITTKLIRILYVLWIIGAAVPSVMIFITIVGGGFSQGIGMGILALILALIVAPIAFFLAVMYGRVLAELIIVVFRISENTAKIAAPDRGPTNQTS